MYQPMLFIHWKQVRYGLIPFVLAAFALPLVAVQGLGGAATDPGAAALALFGSIQFWLPAFPLLAVVVGALLGLSAWSWDHQLRHVHALALPLSRARYVLLKMGAGATLLVLPSLGMWLGAVVATSAIEIPAGLHAYPTALAVRFFMASLMTYALGFAFASSTVKTVAQVATGVLVIGIAVLGMEAMTVTTPATAEDGNLAHAVLSAVHSLDGPGGPFHVFVGNWALIDV